MEISVLKGPVRGSDPPEPELDPPEPEPMVQFEVQQNPQRTGPNRTSATLYVIYQYQGLCLSPSTLRLLEIANP